MPTLRAVLEKEFLTLPLSGLSLAELEQPVTARYVATGAPCGARTQGFRPWPGPHDGVGCWYQLKSGAAIGVRGSPEQPEGIVRFHHHKVRHVDWNRLRTCKVVHDAGSFTKAAAILSITQSAVSRQISALEQEIGCPIFIRDNTGLVPTEAGEQFLQTINRMWEALELGLAQLNELQDEPTGPIVLTTTQAFGSAWMSSKLNRFHQLYPKLEIKLLFSDESELNLRQRAADCAIRFKPPTEPQLVRLLIAEFEYGIFGSREYFEARGIPQRIEDLAHHDLIAFEPSVGEPPLQDINWLLDAGIRAGLSLRPAVMMNSMYGIYRAVEAGTGLASIPFYLSQRSDKLVEVLRDVPRPVIPVYFVYPEELRHSKRIRVLRDFIAEQIRSDWQGRVIVQSQG